jgi:hypothetical protein
MKSLDVKTGDSLLHVGTDVLIAVVMKRSIFWNITPCSLQKVNRHFGGKYRLLLLGRKLSPA